VVENLIDISGLEEVNSLFSSSSTVPQTLQKKQQQKSKKGRRYAMIEEEITALKAKAQETPRKKRLRLPSQEDPRAIIKVLEIPDKGSIQGRIFNTPKMNDLEWERYKIIWEYYMDQVIVYCILQQNMYTTEEMKIIQQGVFNYMT